MIHRKSDLFREVQDMTLEKLKKDMEEQAKQGKNFLELDYAMQPPMRVFLAQSGFTLSHKNRTNFTVIHW